ncbi:MAG: hypothetical protein KJ600_02290 [Nanoarchaeota archaeon]|nr:hypothetical protein [Nanoarchaeota archaeon]MBU1103364.1 hypothetical protein [Nanoarchaeota archaeon]
MAHQAFEVIGEPVLIATERSAQGGIFCESKEFRVVEGSESRPALNFIEPIYDPSSEVVRFARGRAQGERIHPDNPILSFHFGVDHLKLRYTGKHNGVHIFDGELDYKFRVFFNDGNSGVYDKYKEPLRKAGFEVD